MKVTSKKPVGQRMFKSVYHLTDRGKKVRRPLSIEPIGRGWWFNLNIGEWEQERDETSRYTTSYYSMTWDGYNNVYSLKSAKRLISKWNLPKGTWYRVGLPFIGYDFKIKK